MKYVLALTLAVMQKTPDLRLVLMSATGDHQLVRDRIPHCQQLVMKGAMYHVKRCFLAQPMDRSDNMLNMIAQLVITYHNHRAGKPLVDDTCHSKGVKIMVFLPGLAQLGLLILGGLRCLFPYHSMVKAPPIVWA